MVTKNFGVGFLEYLKSLLFKHFEKYTRVIKDTAPSVCKEAIMAPKGIFIIK